MRRIFLFLPLLWTLLVSSTLHASLIPFAVQPSERTVNSGLAVTYYWGLNNIIDNLLQRIEHSIGKAGTALPNLDYKSGHGTVLTSGRHDAVGAHIHGLIKFEEIGDYHFAIESNDGVRFTLNNVLLIEDPNVHADQWSEIATATIERVGWYPLEILYFDKKNTATLRLVWKTPSMRDQLEFVPVPTIAFGHVVTEQKSD